LQASLLPEGCTGVGSEACCALDDSRSLPTSIKTEGGSFRDWDGRVFRSNGRVFRALTARGLADWKALSATELFERFTARGSILPLVVDLADPSPGIGWRNSERSTLIDRGRPELTLCLALVHHLSIGRNIPLRELVDWLRSFCEERDRVPRA
jgi:hypothetical protein